MDYDNIAFIIVKNTIKNNDEQRVTHFLLAKQ